MKIFIFFFLIISSLFAENNKKTFVDSISSDFHSFKESKLEKYSFYISTNDCIVNSNSKQEILHCENILRTKLANYSKQELEKNSLNHEKFIQLKKDMDSKPNFRQLK